MISGAAQADVALLIVPADGNFSVAIQKGVKSSAEIQGQTRAHARILSLLGVHQLIVGINKMDVAGWREDRFSECCLGMREMLSRVGWKSDYVKSGVAFIPLSASIGEGVTRFSSGPGFFLLICLGGRVVIFLSVVVMLSGSFLC